MIVISARNSKLFRLCGWAGILCGLCILIDTLFIELFLPERALTNAVGYSGIILGLLALPGVYLWQREQVGLLGGAGFLLNVIGLALLSGVMFYKNFIAPFLSAEAIKALFAGPTRLVFLLSAFSFMGGVLLFGAATLRAGRFPRMATALYMLGFALFSVEPFLPDPLARTAQVLGSLGVIWMGVTLAGGAAWRSPAPHPSTA